MLNVWATYCSPCLSEMPDLGEIAASYDSTEFQIIGIISDVAEDADEETIAEAKELIAQTNANYPHLLLNESLYSNLLGAVSAVPTTFFVNQDGEVLGYLVGAYEKADWEEIILSRCISFLSIGRTAIRAESEEFEGSLCSAGIFLSFWNPVWSVFLWLALSFWIMQGSSVLFTGFTKVPAFCKYLCPSGTFMGAIPLLVSFIYRNLPPFLPVFMSVGSNLRLV